MVRHSGAVKMTKNENSKKFEKSKIWVGDQVVRPSGVVKMTKNENQTPPLDPPKRAYEPHRW